MTITTITAEAKATTLNVTKNADVLALIQERAALKATEDAGKKAEKARKDIDAQLLGLMANANADSITIAGQKVLKRVDSSSSRIDAAALLQLHPAIHAQFLTITPYSTLRGL